MKMSLKDTLQIGLLLAIGYVLHLIVPGYGAGMKPDTILGMLFVIILMHRNFRVTLASGLCAGIIAALSTTFPGGQLPNIIDKTLTAMVVYFLALVIANPLERLLDKASVKFMGMTASLGTFLSCGIIGFVGTIVSGTIFLGSALFIVGLPAPFAVLFYTVVIPTALANIVAVMVLYPLVAFGQRVIARPAAKEQ
ncbi:MAG: tryptophan transporter [Peptococcaceae bacterium]|jgi:thiamine transporter ThiT|nr:tryptophan transporter [Peptococcaceae bacterium]MDH7523845.1 tryptophan transporter [Peptococcaceae bacterium]